MKMMAYCRQGAATNLHEGYALAAPPHRLLQVEGQDVHIPPNFGLKQHLFG